MPAAFEVKVVPDDGLAVLLKDLPARLHRAQSKGLLRAGIALRDEIVMQLSQGAGPRTLGIRSNDLRKSWIRGLTQWTSKLVEIRSDMPYAAIHEWGGTIVPRSPDGWLVFQVEKGRWVKVKKVVIPERPYVRPAIKAAGPLMQKQIDDSLKEALGTR